MKRNSWPIIRERKNPGGSVAWMVDCGMLDNKRVRHFFKTKAEAETKAAQLKTTRKNEGTVAFAIPERLRVEAIQSAQLLEPHGQSLLEAVKVYAQSTVLLKPYGVSVIKAVEDYLPHLQALNKTVSIDQLASEFLQERRTNGASERYLQDLKNKLDWFKRSFGGRGAATISTLEITHWLGSLKSQAGESISALTKNNFRRVLIVFFNYAVDEEYCPKNPAVKTRKRREMETPVGILTVTQLVDLLKHAPRQLVPFIAIGAFAGLRRSELERLTWDEIDLDGKLIQVTAAKAKSARRRLVRIRPNLSAWLRDFSGSSGQVVPVDMRELLDTTRENAGLKTWPHNALRHSFASYALAHENNASALVLELGHSNHQMLFQHYREVVKPEDAAKYWRIRPGK